MRPQQFEFTKPICVQGVKIRQTHVVVIAVREIYIDLENGSQHSLKFKGGPIQNVGTLNDMSRVFLYGVVLGGVDCLNPDVIFPGVYTNVAFYLDWILDNMKV